jgi:hypothetical protein
MVSEFTSCLRGECDARLRPAFLAADFDRNAKAVKDAIGGAVVNRAVVVLDAVGVNTNPCHGRRLPHTRVEETVFLTPPEFRLLRDHIERATRTPRRAE